MPYIVWNKCVFKSFIKLFRLLHDLITNISLFHTSGAAVTEEQKQYKLAYQRLPNHRSRSPWANNHSITRNILTKNNPWETGP